MSTCDMVINDAFWPVLDTPLHNVQLMGGRGSGKSHFIAKQYLPLQCLGERPVRVMAMRKVATTIRLSIWRALIEGLKALGLYDQRRVNKTDREIFFPNGSIIACCGADDPEKLKSLEGIDIVWKEEATEFTEEDHLNIDAAIKSPRKKIIDTYNPIPLIPAFSSYLKSRYWDKQNPDALAIKTTYRDNLQFLPDHYVKTLEDLKDTNPKLYEMWANGNYTTLEGVIFENWDVVDSIPTEGGVKDFGYGLDFGFTVHPSVLVHVFVRGLGTPEAEAWLREELYETGLNNQQLAHRMRVLRVDKYADVIADCAEPKSIDELCQAGFNVRPAVKGPDSVRAGISQLQAMRLHVERGSTNLIKEFSAYSWKTNKDGKPLPEPVDAFNHGIDAIRYCLTRVPQTKPWFYEMGEVVNG